MNEIMDEKVLLKLTMLLGSFYDWSVAALSFFFPSLLPILGVEYPTEMMYFRFGGLLMLVLPFFYLLAYFNTERNIAVVSSTILVRLTGFMFLFAHFLQGEALLWLLFGIGDLFFGVLHYVFLKKNGYTLMTALTGRKR